MHREWIAFVPANYCQLTEAAVNTELLIFNYSFLLNVLEKWYVFLSLSLFLEEEKGAPHKFWLEALWIPQRLPKYQIAKVGKPQNNSTAITQGDMLSFDSFIPLQINEKIHESNRKNTATKYVSVSRLQIRKYPPSQRQIFVVAPSPPPPLLPPQAYPSTYIMINFSYPFDCMTNIN